MTVEEKLIEKIEKYVLTHGKLPLDVFYKFTKESGVSLYFESLMKIAFTHCAKYAARCISTNKQANFLQEWENFIKSLKQNKKD
jgi:hypothetical protein